MLIDPHGDKTYCHGLLNVMIQPTKLATDEITEQLASHSKVFPCILFLFCFFRIYIFTVLTKRNIFASLMIFSCSKKTGWIVSTESVLKICLKLNKNIQFQNLSSVLIICTSQVLPRWKEEAAMNFHAFWRGNDNICWGLDSFLNSPRRNSSP